MPLVLLRCTIQLQLTACCAAQQARLEVRPFWPVCPSVQAAKKQALARGEKVSMVETDWRWWSQDWADQNPYKARGLAVGTAAARLSVQN